MLLELAQDNADEVQQAAVTQLLPAILTWCQGDTLLTTCLLPGILAEAQKLLDQYVLGRDLRTSSQLQDAVLSRQDSERLFTAVLSCCGMF